MSKDFNYFRIKMAYKGANDLGAIVPIKSEDLVMATCYTEAEQIAYKLAEGKDEFGDVDIEIVRTKISEVAYNDTFATDTELICGLISYFFEESEDTEVGLYCIKYLLFIMMWTKRLVKPKVPTVQFMYRLILHLKR